MKKKTSSSLTREDWIWGALDMLAKKGGRLRIDDLVNSLGVTKGSFYWHFKNRNDFLDSLLLYWADEITTRAIQNVTQLDGTPEERLYAIMETVQQRKFAKYEMGVRSLAVVEPKAAKAVRKVDQNRLAFIRSLFSEMGFKGDELEMRTRTYVIYVSLQDALFVNVTGKKEKELNKRRIKLFTRK